MRLSILTALAPALFVAAHLQGGVEPVRARTGMVVCQNAIASRVGADVLQEGGTAIDAAVATAFALAVVHPGAGNIGGGGFLLSRPAQGAASVYDFREAAPQAAFPTLFLKDGVYDPGLHHQSYRSVGVPGTVAGLHLAWKEGGTLPWRRLVEPAIGLARDGFPLSRSLAGELEEVLVQMKPFPAAYAQFSKDGRAYEPGDVLRQRDLARTLERIAKEGPAGFYEGETAALIEAEMRAHGGLITKADLKAYRPFKRTPLTGSYRGYEILGVPPPSSGGTVVLEMLNVLEGYDLKSRGFGAASEVHVIAEAMRRAFADRAHFLGDPDFNPSMPVGRLISKDYADRLRRTIDERRASRSSPETLAFAPESPETTHISVVDGARNAVALTYTLEDSYGVKAVVPGAGFLLNNEMGDFNAKPGLTDRSGLIGTKPNLAEPGKRMLSSMSPTIVTKEGVLFMVVGSPGGRTIPNTVLLTILNVIDFGMNMQEAIDAPRFHHQWLPDALAYEARGLSPDTIALLEEAGYDLVPIERQGCVQGILVEPRGGLLEGGSDRRAVDGGAVGR
jgi:gamma-glutamyltranspeptidase/glutathione hydrolase